MFYSKFPVFVCFPIVGQFFSVDKVKRSTTGKIRRKHGNYTEKYRPEKSVFKDAFL